MTGIVVSRNNSQSIDNVASADGIKRRLVAERDQRELYNC